MKHSLLKPLFILTISFSFHTFHLQAQNGPIPQPLAEQNLKDIGNISPTGMVYAYTSSANSPLGSPFLFDDWKKASLITFQKDTVTDIYLKYNLTNEILTQRNEEGDSTVLRNNFVSQFMIYDDKQFQVLYFKYISQQVARKNKVEEGFYQVLYGGNASLLVKRKKYLHKGIESRDHYSTSLQRDSYKFDNDFFIGKTNGAETDIAIIPFNKKKKELLEILGDKSEEISSFIKEHKLKMGKEEDLIEILYHYDGLVE